MKICRDWVDNAKTFKRFIISNVFSIEWCSFYRNAWENWTAAYIAKQNIIPIIVWPTGGVVVIENPKKMDS